MFYHNTCTDTQTHTHTPSYLTFRRAVIYTLFNQVYNLKSLTKLQIRWQPGLGSHLRLEVFAQHPQVFGRIHLLMAAEFMVAYFFKNKGERDTLE